MSHFEGIIFRAFRNHSDLEDILGDICEHFPDVDGFPADEVGEFGDWIERLLREAKPTGAKK